MKHGAIHDPDNPAVQSAIDYASVRTGLAPAAVPDWFAAWSWDADGDVLLNDELGCCVPVADLRLVQGWLAARGVLWRVPPELVRLRYEATGGYDGTPATDLGTVVQVDAFGWQAAPIAAAGAEWHVRWCSVPVHFVSSALRRGPLLVTLGLTEADGQDPWLWRQAAAGPFTLCHRVVVGGLRGGMLNCRTYGYDRLVDPSRVIAADLFVHVDAPADLRIAGIDWSAVA